MSVFPRSSVSWAALLLVAYSARIAAPTSPDSVVVGAPIIQCGPLHIGITVQTKRTLSGSLYIRGRHSVEGCFNRSTSGDTFATLNIPLADASNCGIETKRNLKNGEIVMSGVWIISSHPTFVTKADEAYAVNCVFKQKELVIHSEIDVADLITRVMGRTAQMPSVVMKIIEGSSPDTSLAPLRQAEVGQPITLVWYVPQGASSVFGIRVRHCTVESREGSRVPLLENGCSEQPLVVDDVQYQDDFAEAYATAKAFKFADQQDLSFKCTVMVCTKVTNGEMETHDACSTQQVCSKRPKRALDHTWRDELLENDLETFEERIVVIEAYNQDEVENDTLIRSMDADRLKLYRPAKSRVLKRSAQWNVCMRKPFFALLWSIVLLMYLVTFFLSAVLIVGRSPKARTLTKAWKCLK